MRELYYENQGSNTYLVYEVQESDVVDTMGLGMLTNNKISGLAQTIFTQMDNRKFIKFNVSAKVSASQLFMGPVNKKRLLGVFGGIVNAMLSAEDYMLDANSILLDLDYIFTDVSTCETVLVCLPLLNAQTEKTDMGLFFRNIMFRTQFEQTENCDYVARLINYLNGSALFSMTDFQKLLEEIERPAGGNPGMNPQQAAGGPQMGAVSMGGQGPQAGQTYAGGQGPQAGQTFAGGQGPQAGTSFAGGQSPQGDQTFQGNQDLLVKPISERVLNPQMNPARQENPAPAGKKRTPVQGAGNNVPSGMQGMAIPPKQQQKKQEPAKQQGGAGQEKEISLFYLLQHYNKDNAAAYKEQKEEKKRQAAEAKGNKPSKKQAEKKGAAGQGSGTQASINLGFAIPGQPAQPAGAGQKQQAPAAAQGRTDQSAAGQPFYQGPVGQSASHQPMLGQGAAYQSMPGQGAVGQPFYQASPAGPQAGGYPSGAGQYQPMPGQSGQQAGGQASYQAGTAGQYQSMPGQGAAGQPSYQASPAEQGAAGQPAYQAPGPQAGYGVPGSQAASPVSFGETTVLGGGAPGETTVLGQSAQQEQMIPQLIRKKTGEQILLNKPVYRIGKERSYVDYFIGDNTAISRSHANFITRDGEYFVVDTNSTNHTFVNGTMIQSNAETKLQHGDRIRLANEDFEFRLY